MEYEAFLRAKVHEGAEHGFDPVWMPPFLFDFQKALVTWALRKGRAALFEDCGLGKTAQELVWAENVHRKTNRPVLILTPLAVAPQTVTEAAKFGVEVRRSEDGTVHPGLNVVNYERLHHFHPEDFGGVVCDESSILKSFDGARKAAITDFMRKVAYRLLATATAAPNDYVELGTSSEALGYLGHMDMLGRFFVNAQGNSSHRVLHRQRHQHTEPGRQWRFKGHAEEGFWRWVCSWARAMRRPSDLGFDDSRFALPPLVENEHRVHANTKAPGMLFELPAQGLHEEREEARRTIGERCEMAASLCMTPEPHIAWCHLNDEGDLLERLIPNSIQVKGPDSQEWKEAAVRWFRGEMCICGDPLFRAKLAAWRNDRTATGRATTESIEPSGLPLQLPTSDEIAMYGATTCGSGSAVTESESQPTARPTPTSATRADASATRKMRRSVKRRSKPLGSTASDTPASAGPLDARATTACPEWSTRGSVPSVVEGAGSARARPGSMSTTATHRVTSEDSCVSGATSGSDTSRTTPSVLSAPPCICGHASGRRTLISKPVMFGYGLNLQVCAHMTYFPSHSFESYYQAVRRCWRFGQTKPVVVDVVTTEGGHDVMENLKRKAVGADRMFSSLVAHMNNALALRGTAEAASRAEVPAWL